MGNSHPTSTHHMEDVVAHMMPLYYTPLPIQQVDIDNCRGGWDAIMSSQSAEFNTVKHRTGFIHDSCRTWFSKVFYYRIIDIQPHIEYLFDNSYRALSNSIENMISLAISQLQNFDEFSSSLKSIATSQIHHGIYITDFFSYGDALFYSLEQVLGREFTPQDLTSWQKLYSSILRVIVPACIKYLTSNPRKPVVPPRSRRDMHSEIEVNIAGSPRHAHDSTLELYVNNDRGMSHMLDDYEI
mmetsp:Transcript_6163/g.9298  ORF Transcript_6163/g.9298 Transcript_6163/m.9298 type:complete len:241 (+) Transcript_6163:61-783(+)